MPRHVYRPPRGRFSIWVAIIGGLVCTGLLFLAIPLSQKLANMMAPEPDPVVDIDEITPPDPFIEDDTPPEMEEEEPPPPEPPPEPDQLDLGLNLADIPTGPGGGIQLSLGNFDIAGSDDDGIGNSLDQDPKAISKPQPTYPRKMLQKKIGGRVQIAAKVSAQGNITTASVRKSSGQASLDQAALKAAKRWKFKPAIRGGRPAEGKVVIPFLFEVRS